MRSRARHEPLTSSMRLNDDSRALCRSCTWTFPSCISSSPRSVLPLLVLDDQLGLRGSTATSESGVLIQHLHSRCIENGHSRRDSSVEQRSEKLYTIQASRAQSDQGHLRLCCCSQYCDLRPGPGGSQWRQTYRRRRDRLEPRLFSHRRVSSRRPPPQTLERVTCIGPAFQSCYR